MRRRDGDWGKGKNLNCMMEEIELSTEIDMWFRAVRDKM